MLLLVGLCGELGIKEESKHFKKGRVSTDLFYAFDSYLLNTNNYTVSLIAEEYWNHYR